ncbi:MAG: hypothetical protein E7488_05860 [Ruminococcaceae bacterium]|nr:hypothetical protein [Oscillospiraceae bacterium]
MKKIISIILAAAMLLSGCGKEETVDIQHGRKDNTTAVLYLPNGEIIEGCPDWFYFDDELVSVQIEGVIYRVNSDSFALIVEVE